MKKPTNSKGGNKKLHKRPHVLDVTLTQHKERAKRARRAFRRVFSVFFLIALVVGSYVGGKEALRRFVWENPDYLLSDVRFNTDGTLLRDDVLDHAGIVEGRNIFRLDIAGIRQRIAELPQVERVQVERQLPNRVTVAIVERKPIAWVMKNVGDDPIQRGSKAYLIDARAIPMKPRQMLPQFAHLPMICGFPVENLADGQRVTSYEILAALELIRLNEGNTRWQIRTIDVQSGYSLLVTDIRRIQILFHLDHLQRQIDRLHKLFKIIGPDREKELVKVNLFGERNTYVVYRPPEEPEPEQSELVPVSNNQRAPALPATVPAKPTTAPRTTQAAKSTPPAKVTPAPKKSAGVPSKPTPLPVRKATPIDPIKKPFNSNG
jgi:hypothetical protein